MLAGIDTGPIAYQALFDIEETDTGFSVSTKCIKFGMELIKQLLDAAAVGPDSVPLIEQNLGQREYFGRGTPEDGWLAWSRPARQIYNFVRAADYSPFASPWKTPKSRMGDHEVGFVKVTLTGQACDAEPGTIGRPDGGKILVASGDEWVAVNRLSVNGQNVNAVDLLKPGARLEWIH
jgi:methionyl-tRNA formyltransferase